jgi:Cu+-exporting ATPase
LLEHLYKLDSGIKESRSDFLKKELHIVYDPRTTSLRKVVEVLAKIGYAPALNPEQKKDQKILIPQRKRLYKITVAGFCFANIMMLSFPDYFNIGNSSDHRLEQIFSYLTLALSLPAFIYSGSEFYISAYRSLKAKYLNVDLPLTISIWITFARSVWEVSQGISAGYFDSMSGIIFFMLIGKYFQERTMAHLHFERTYKSYFPISVSKLNDAGIEKCIPLSEIAVGDHLLIRSGEVIPADGRLTDHSATIDYSFVTGEQKPIRILQGELIYAGGKNQSSAIRISVEKEVMQSYLTQLWNREKTKDLNERQLLLDRLGKYFTFFLLLLSFGGFIYWYPTDHAKALNALTTVLIVACPCALLLSVTFTNGFAMRQLARLNIYVRHPNVLEKLSSINQVVFDKTGTLTSNKQQIIEFRGIELSPNIYSVVKSMAKQSAHPLSRKLTNYLTDIPECDLRAFQEIPGKGLQAYSNGIVYRLGSSEFANNGSEKETESGMAVYLNVNGKYMGYFHLETQFREGLNDVVGSLYHYHPAVLSGDTPAARETLKQIFGPKASLNFNQSPENKLNIIQHMQLENKKVMMIGDGLNDSGALMQSDIGVSISEDINNFSPACDIIIEAGSFQKLPYLLHYAKYVQRIIIGSFILSLIYNIFGVGLALQGLLHPVYAAILMPLSSISILLFTYICIHMKQWKNNQN